MKTLWTEDLNSQIYKDALAIRYKVFVDEQKVPSDLEIDEFEEKSIYGVLYDSDQAVATVRIYSLNNKVYKVQRVAVLKQLRGQGLGKRLMLDVERKAKEMQVEHLKLDSQNTAIPFYQKLGYEISSDEFLDAGILHHTMIKKI